MPPIKFKINGRANGEIYFDPPAPLPSLDVAPTQYNAGQSLLEIANNAGEAVQVACIRIGRTACQPKANAKRQGGDPLREVILESCAAVECPYFLSAP